MGPDAFKRKITAIMSADVVGYSKLMGDDEAATVKTLELFKSVMSSLISQHRGRVIDSPGDNMLSEFESVVDAVQCAVAIQKELKSRNSELPENRIMQFRIGINLGDVIHEGDRIYGDGVNIAARLESLADPGGICVSKTAFDHIETKLPLGYEFLGDQEVKNITRPVGAYRVLMEPRVTVAQVKKKKDVIPFWKRKAFISGTIAALIVIVGVVAWHVHFRSPQIAPASLNKMAFELPDRPSIAVLPFVNIGGDTEQGYFCDGLTEEIITSLSKLTNLFVISRNSVFTYKGKPVNINKVAEELGVRYVLEGSIRKAGDKVRITAQLIDALSGHHLWAERYDRNLKEIFIVQDDLTKNIITALQVKLTQGEQIRSSSRGTDNLQAYLKLLQAREMWRKMTKESNVLARQMAEEAMVLDKDYVSPYLVIAATHMVDVFLQANEFPEESLKQAFAFNKKALDLDNSYAHAHSQLGLLYVMTRQYDKGVKQAESSVELNPNSASANDLLGITLSYAGRHDEAITFHLNAIRLEPLAPGNYYQHLCRAYFFTGNCSEAITACEEGLHRVNNLMVRLDATVAYSICGRREEAQAVAAEVLRMAPNFSSDGYMKKLFYKDAADVNRYIDCLKRAGLK
jgi:adenylate cyclase